MADCCDGISKYYVGDLGTKIVVDACVDITAATTRELHVQKPDGTLVTWVGALEGTTSIAYFVQAGDWDQAGDYRVQAYVEMAGWQGHGDTARFRVSARFA